MIHPQVSESFDVQHTFNVDAEDRGKEDRLLPGLPSLRTVRADLPHTALRLMVLPSRGLTGRSMGGCQTEQPLFGEEAVGPGERCILIARNTPAATTAV